MKCMKFKKFRIQVSSLPICKGVIFSKADCPSSESDQKYMPQFPYCSVSGCLSFISSRTRPEINYAVNIFSQFQGNPDLSHWERLLRLFGYVKYT